MFTWDVHHALLDAHERARGLREAPAAAACRGAGRPHRLAVLLRALAERFDPASLVAPR